MKEQLVPNSTALGGDWIFIIKYKSEILASEHLIDIFRLNILQEYDWSLSSLKKEQARTDLTNDLDNELRVYKIKNFIKELPIYEILFKRGNNAIITEACIRCYKKESKELNVTTKDRKRKRIEGNVEENNNRNYEA
uniref:Uncharacterized protein n=1 Tax=Rhizophagus irregularis (strain DAOM 181602 / DAOM 197198 / MUCL 43194) TaxID=747089 RepID=U9TFY8_RHIID